MRTRNTIKNLYQDLLMKDIFSILILALVVFILFILIAIGGKIILKTFIKYKSNTIKQSEVQFGGNYFQQSPEKENILRPETDCRIKIEDPFRETSATCE